MCVNIIPSDQNNNNHWFKSHAEIQSTALKVLHLEVYIFVDHNGLSTAVAWVISSYLAMVPAP